jgi:hypothetical protein
MAAINNTSYKVQTDLLETETGLAIEDGTLVTLNGVLKHQYNGQSNEVAYKPAYINYFDFSSGSVTDITTSNTWVKLNADTTSIFSRDGLVHTNNKVTNTGSSKVFKVEGIISVSAGSNQTIHAAFFKNGVLHPCSEESSVTSGSNRVESVPFHCLVELDTDDYIEVWVKNQSHTTDITLHNINVIITEA